MAQSWMCKEDQRWKNGSGTGVQLGVRRVREERRSAGGEPNGVSLTEGVGGVWSLAEGVGGGWSHKSLASWEDEADGKVVTGVN